MIEAKIKEFEEKSKTLDVDELSQDHCSRVMREFTHQFYETIKDRSVVSNTQIDYTQLVDLGSRAGIDELVTIYEDAVIKSGIDTASGKYMGFIPGGGLYLSAVGDYLSAISNTYGGAVIGSPGAVEMEKSLLRWIADCIGYDDRAYGNLTSGGSIANMTALITAREVHAIKSRDVENAVIYLSHHTHYSSHKALRMIGMSESIIRNVPVDDGYRMDADKLKDMIDADIKRGLRPWVIVASAGTTDVGSVDPLQRIGAIAKAYNIWLHVDAAYGGFFLLTSHGKKILSGINEADSVTLDPHKSLFMPYGLGAMVVKDRRHLRLAMAETNTPCLQDASEMCSDFSPYDYSLELTKHFRAVRMWLPLKFHGVQPFIDALDEKLLLAKYFARKLQSIFGIRLLCEPELSVVVFRCDNDEETRKLLKYINTSGSAYLTSTTINNQYYIRMACLSVRTHLDEIETLLKLIKDFSRPRDVFANLARCVTEACSD